MTPQELSKVAAKFGVSKDVAALSLEAGAASVAAPLVQEGRRVKQRTKPLMNKLEAEWGKVLEIQNQGVKIHAQAVSFVLANGHRYLPDFVSFALASCWEVKGPHAFRGGFENLKTAAALYQELTWFLAWKDAGQWRIQRIAS